MNTRRPRIVATIFGVLALATGCTDGGLPVFRDSQQSQDQLPTAVASEALEIDPATTRLVGDWEGRAYYAALQNQNRDLCLIAVDQAVEPTMACSAGRWVQLTLENDQAALFVDEDAEPDEQWDQVSPFLYVRSLNN